MNIKPHFHAIAHRRTNINRQWVAAFSVAAISFMPAHVIAQIASPVAASVSKLTLTDHLLVGKIWDSKQKNWATEAELKNAIFSHTFILLGETHDNQQHHQRHLQVLNWLTANQQKPALLMEQFDIEHQAAMNAAIAAGKNADEIAVVGKLNRRGWHWPQYQPLVNLALANQLPIIAANLSRATARGVFTKGFSAIPAYALPANLSPQLFNSTWNNARQEAVVETMVASHCGQLPKERAPGMVNAQRARDAVMAEAIFKQQKIGAVLIAGRGHVRRDIGVPLYIKQINARANLLSIGMVEVISDKNSPEAYAELTAADNATQPFDYVWFSAKQERPDPCEAMTIGTFAAPVKLINPSVPPISSPSATSPAAHQ